MTRVHDWGWVDNRKRGLLVVAAEPGEQRHHVWARAHRPLYALNWAVTCTLLCAVVCFLLRVPAPTVFWIICGCALLGAVIALLQTGALRGHDPDHWTFIRAGDSSAEAEDIRNLLEALEHTPADIALRTELYDAITAHLNR